MKGGAKFAFVTALTLGRAPLALAGVGASLANLAKPDAGWVAAAALLLAASAVTDLFDGALARRWGVTSRFGALADPLMDKVFYLSTLPVATFVALWNESFVHASFLLARDLVSLLRDQWVSFLRSVGSGFGADVRASFSGKLRTFVGFPVIVFVHVCLGCEVLARREVATLPPWWCGESVAIVCECVLAAVTAWSMADYTVRFAPYLGRSCAPGSRA